MTHLANIFNSVGSCRSKCMLLGDLNINLLTETTTSSNFNNFMISHYFLQYITIPTRFANNNRPSLLDHIWYNSPDVGECGAISFDFTDHIPCFIVVKLNVETNTLDRTKISFRIVNEINKNNFLSAVSQFDWSNIYSDDINASLENFCFTLDQTYCGNFPLKTKMVTNKQLNKPWITPEIKQLIDRKSEYFELYRLGIITHTENNVFKNRISSLCRRAEAEYYKKSFLNLRNNSRSKWKLIFSVTSCVNLIFQTNKYPLLTIDKDPINENYVVYG